ncbi:PQQ-binding-like beta-propeller repeat protein [Halorarius halobius]|uniref:outer membrane protein assembly factor BamB family protein n=1 Tax=Halorarius halobius TaxID=2962671 RepID=UPI0020CF3B54|nr:PQQ-binding-like beta-propeller repeat protein [Halorarius halobius]
MAVLSRRDALRAGAAMLPVAVAGCSSSCPADDRPTPSRVVGPGDTGGTVPDPTVDWPTYRGNARNTGVVAGAAPPADPAVAWAVDLPGEARASAPSLAGGVVHVVDGGGTLHALDARDGTRRWSVAVGTGPAAGPPTVTDDGVVVAGDGGTALVADGETVWTADHAATAAAVVGEAVYLPTAGELLALDPVDGSVRWRVPFDGPVSRPALADGSVYATAAGLGAVSEAGETRWTAGSGGVDSLPVVAEDVLVGSYDGLFAYATGDGRERWQFERGGGRGYDAPVATADSLYAVELVGEGPDALFALNRGDEPEPRWCVYLGEGSVDAASDGGPLVSMPAGEGPEAEFALQSLSRERGQGGWAFTASRRVPAPALSAGSAFLTTDRTVVALGEADG